jgi:hypothetical protein
LQQKNEILLTIATAVHHNNNNINNANHDNTIINGSSSWLFFQLCSTMTNSLDNDNRMIDSFGLAQCISAHLVDDIHFCQVMQEWTFLLQQPVAQTTRIPTNGTTSGNDNCCLLEDGALLLTKRIHNLDYVLLLMNTHYCCENHNNTTHQQQRKVDKIVKRRLDELG